MNQWPNVRLRVIEGWDEDNRHTVNSLHYEGRAVDITTSDRDRTKYGMLARLAVEAGFDWVHYESRSHVHCSVKSEKADTIRNNGCFDAKGLVETPAGQLEMSQLQTNDLVLTLNPQTGKLQFSPIIMWLDRDESGRDLFVELQTKSGRRIRLTSSHLIYLANEAPQQLDLHETAAQNGQLNNLSTRPPLRQSAGSDDNNQNNYYYYDTQTVNVTDEGKQHSLLNSNNNRRQLSIDSFSLSRPAAAASTLDEYTFVTYARNAIVGQYLLINPSNEIKHHGEVESKRAANSKRGKQLHTTYFSSERLPLRVVFSQILNNQVQADAIEQTSIRFDQIVSVNYAVRDGIYAPLTREGNIVVDSVVASCYALISDHELAHSAFAPIRWLSYAREWIFGLQPTFQIERNLEDSSTTRRQIHWYASLLYTIGRFILPSGYLY